MKRWRHSLVVYACLSLLIGVLLSTLLPYSPVAKAAGGVAITDNLTFTGDPPPDDSVTLVTKDNDNYGSTLSSSTPPSINGNVATFVFNFTSTDDNNNKVIQPVPAGQYFAISIRSNQRITVTVDGSGSGSGTINGTYIPGSSAVSGSGSTGGSDSNSGNTNTTCETTGSPLTWILCPVFNMVSDFSQWALQNIIQPFLKTSPISTSPSNASFKVWSEFRVYGNIVLVIALLVVVFGEAIGGGIVDAYTAKKMLPRILVAVILINLSIYIVAALVDVTNIVGGGISNVLLEPFKNSSVLNFQLNASQQFGAFGVGILGVILGGAGISGMLFGFLGGAGAFASVALEAAFFLLLPVILGALAVFFTLIARQGIILFLILISPVAFALYCLPNTEQYFKKWWKVLWECLLVYPIVMIIFAVADILSMTILQANNVKIDSGGGFISTAAAGGALGTRETLAAVIAFFLQFMPLFAAPFAFKISGGLLGQLNNALTTGAKSINKLADTRREQAKQKYNTRALQGRQRKYEDWQKVRSDQNRSAFTRGLARFGTGRIGGYNLEAAMSAQRGETAKAINDQIATGKDDEIRGLTVNKAWASKQAEATQRGDSTWTDGQWRMNGSMRQFKTLGGGWVNEADVDAGQGRWGRDTFAQQAALSYEMRKANTEGDLQNIATNYHNVAQGAGGWNMGDGQAGGTWIGAAFERQNEHLEYKHTDWKTGDLSKARDFVNEVYEKKGSYPLAQMGSNTIEQLKNAHTMAVASGDTDQQEKIAAISQTFMHELGTMGSGKPEIDQATAGLPGRRTASTPGAAHVAERVRELASMTGVSTAEPTGLYTDPDHAPTPNRREQT